MAKTNNNASKASTANKTTKGIAVKKKRTAGKKQDGETRKKERPYFVVCVGASAGGLSAIREFIAQLPADLNAAVFIVWHLSRTALGDVFTERIRKDAKMLCKQPKTMKRSGAARLISPFPMHTCL
jgi:chemotaxis response regulator CheB